MMVRAIPESGLQCMLGKHPQAIGECLQEGSRVVGINGRETDDLDLVSSGLFSFWAQIDLSTDCLGQEMLFCNDQMPAFGKPEQVIDRADQYFGFVHNRFYALFGGPEFLWHCSSLVRAASQLPLQTWRGRNIQLVGFTDAEASSHLSMPLGTRSGPGCA